MGRGDDAQRVMPTGQAHAAANLDGRASSQRIHEALTAGAMLRQRYRTRTVIGTFLIELPTPRTVRALALAGFDFVVLDLEHSNYDVERMGLLATEAQLLGMPAVVRLWSHDPGLIGKALDAGANGVMVPHVETPAQAQAAVEAVRYAPLGDRSMAPLLSYRTAPVALSRLAEDMLVIVQIEGSEGLANSATIGSLPGIDAMFVGVYDLSQALGCPGQVDSAEVIDAANQVARTTRDAMLGVYVDDPRNSTAWANRGFRLQCVSFDGQLLMNGATAALAAAQNAVG